MRIKVDGLFTSAEIDSDDGNFTYEEKKKVREV